MDVTMAQRLELDYLIYNDPCVMVTSNASSTPVQSMEIILPSRSSSSTQPVSMLNLQALASYFMFVSFLPYGTFTVVTFVIRFF